MKKRLKIAQIQSQVFVYLIVAILFGFILMFSYNTIKNLGEKKVEHEMLLFQENIKKDIKSWALHVGSVGEETYIVPSFITRACFVDISRKEETLNDGFFDEYPLIIDSLETTNNNMFLFDESDDFYNSFDVGEVILLGNYNCEPFTCFNAKNHILEFLMAGKGHSTLLLPVDINKEYIMNCDCPQGCKIRPVSSFSFVGDMQYIPVFLNASNSYDLDDSVAIYQWEFGDGYNANNTVPITQHIYQNAQEYTISLTVFDDDGFKDVDSKTININPYNLIAVALGNKASISIGEKIFLNGSDSIGRGLSYKWYFGDIKDQQGDGEFVSFHYVQSGSKVITLEVTDVFGDIVTDKVTVEVIK